LTASDDGFAIGLNIIAEKQKLPTLTISVSSFLRLKPSATSFMPRAVRDGPSLTTLILTMPPDRKDLTAKEVQLRRLIRAHVERLHGQRKLVEGLDRDGKDARQARLALRIMLVGLEAMLLECQRLQELREIEPLARAG
jgi:hypothetical protein